MKRLASLPQASAAAGRSSGALPGAPVGAEQAPGCRLVEGGAAAQAVALLITLQGYGPGGDQLHRAGQDLGLALRDHASTHGCCSVRGRDTARLLEDLWAVAVSASTQCDRGHREAHRAAGDAYPASHGRLDGAQTREGRQQCRVEHSDPTHVAGQEGPREQRHIDVIKHHEQLRLQRLHGPLQLRAEVRRPRNAVRAPPRCAARRHLGLLVVQAIAKEVSLCELSISQHNVLHFG
mmetsp:Transcript_84380/g.233919  ORF Transcript_84380/g.233919 Transcript_84380/m.233919 type:complete len:236 (-) Transcript_84380:1844-2551(-)